MNKVVVGIISRYNSSDQEEFLLVSSKKDFGQYTGFYYPPGGHAEDGESEEITLKREIQEELSLEIEPKEKLAETTGDVPDQITSWWRCEIKSGEIKIQEAELQDARFFTRDEMKKINLWPATKKFFEENCLES